MVSQSLRSFTLSVTFSCTNCLDPTGVPRFFNAVQIPRQLRDLPTSGGHIDALNLMPAPASIFSSNTLYIGRVRPGETYDIKRRRCMQKCSPGFMPRFDSTRKSMDGQAEEEHQLICLIAALQLV